MALDDDFLAAKARTEQLRKMPANEELLELYALYKQATQGDVQGTRPGMLDFKARAKYDAWAKRAGMPKDGAKQAYIAIVARLAQRYA